MLLVKIPRSFPTRLRKAGMPKAWKIQSWRFVTGDVYRNRLKHRERALIAELDKMAFKGAVNLFQKFLNESGGAGGTEPIWWSQDSIPGESKSRVITDLDAGIENDSTVVLGGVLPIFKSIGIIDLSKAEAVLRSETIGWVKKLIDANGTQTIRAKGGYVGQSASLGIFSLSIGRAQVEMWSDQGKVAAHGDANIYITNANLDVTASPKLSNMHAHAIVNVGVGRFTISNGQVDIDPGKARLGTSILGIDIGITVPGITSMTPGNVLKAIESIFDFDIDSLFDAIIHHHIEISLMPSGKGKDGQPATGDPRPLGDGDPLPPADQKADPAPAGPPQSPPRGQQNGGSPPPAKSDGASGGAGPSQQLLRPIVDPTPPDKKEPPAGDNTIHGYVPGSLSIRFEDIHKDGLWKAVATVNGVETWDYDWHFLIPAAVKQRLDGKDAETVLTIFSRMVPGQPALPLCPLGNRHDNPPRAVTVEATGKTFVEELFPGGTFKPLKLDWEQVGKPGLTGGAGLLANLSTREFMLLDGDLKLIADLATAEVMNRPIAKFERQPASKFSPGRMKALSIEEGYTYVQEFTPGEPSLVYQSRSGSRVELPVNGRLYTDANLGIPAHPRGKALRQLFAAVACNGGSVGYVVGGAVDLPANKKDSPVLLALAAGGARSLVLARENGDLVTFDVVDWTDWPIGTDPAWDAGRDLTAQRLLELLDTEAWETISCPRLSDGGRRIVLARGLGDGAGKPWAFRALMDPAGNSDHRMVPVVLPRPSAVYDGTLIPGLLAKWTAPNGPLAEPPASAPDTREWRWWFAEQLLRGDDWAPQWTSAPRPLYFIDLATGKP